MASHHLRIRCYPAALLLSAACAFSSVVVGSAAPASSGRAGAQQVVPLVADTKPEDATPKVGNTAGAKKFQSKYGFKTYRANAGGQEAIDACTGGLTNMTAVSEYLTLVEGKPKRYYPIHNHCGGRPILELKLGDLVLIENAGKYRVVGDRDVTIGSKASVLLDMPGDTIIQTCYDSTSDRMRAVALEKITT